MNPPEELSLVDSLNSEWLRLLPAVMRDCGPAAQTLGGLLAITNRETFTAVSGIARAARLPEGTVRKHLATLAQHGWIKHKGRQRTRADRLRRTATIVITERTRAEAKAEYCMLPWWACCDIRNHGRLPWRTRAVLAVVVSELAKLKAEVERDQGPCDANELEGAIENWGGCDRFKIPLRKLEETTGLSRVAIIHAKRSLGELGIVDWRGGEDEDGRTHTDQLWPFTGFRAIITPAGPGVRRVSFRR